MISHVQGWKGSAKAKHLVMAIRDHFADGSRAALAVIRDITEGDGVPQPDDAKRKIQEISDVTRRISPDDLWALQYITIFRLQPLIEALDDDASSFVTVAEVNAFTTARPGNWR